MNCEQAETLLAAFVFGEVDPPIVHELSEHIERCETCAAALRDIRAASELVEESLASAPAPALSTERREKLAGLKWPKKREPSRLFRPVYVFGQAVATRTTLRPLMTVAASIVLLVLLAGMLLPSLGRAREEARSASSKSNLKQIGTGVNIWLTKHGKDTAYPPSLESLTKDGVIREKRIFRDPRRATKSKPGEFSSDYESILDNTGGQLQESQVDSSTPLAWEKKSGSDEGGRNVVFFDGSVRHMPEKKFQKMMKKTESRLGGIARSSGERTRWGSDKADAKKAEEAPADRPRRSKPGMPAAKRHAKVDRSNNFS